MSRFYFLIVSSLMLCVSSVYAQTENHVFSIEELFRLADENNRNILAVSTAAEVANEKVQVAKNAYLPAIDAAISLSYNGDGVITDRDFSNSFVVPIPHFGNNLSLEVSQVVFTGGAIRNGVKIAELQQQIAMLNVEQKRQEIRFLIVGNYLELYKLNNQLQVFISNIEQTQQVLNDMQEKVNQEIALQNDITRYELQLQNLNYTKIQLQNAIALLNNQLTTAVGLPQSVVILPDSNIVTNISTIKNQMHNPATTLAVQMVENAEKIAEHSEKISRAERLPQIAVFAGNYLNGPVTIEIPALNNNFNYWAVGVGVKYSFENLYKSGAKIRANHLFTRQVNEEKAALEEQISLAMNEAYVHYNEAFVLLETKAKSVELADQNYHVISYRYENDLALITDLLDAASQKLDAELQIINARINIIYHYYKLKYISGIL